MVGTLSPLIDVICSGRFVRPGLLSGRLERWYGTYQPRLTTKEAVDLYLRENDLIPAIKSLIGDEDTIVEMAQSVDNRCRDNEEVERAIRYLVRGLGIACPPNVGEDLGAVSAKQRVETLIQKIEDYEREDRMDELDLVKLSLSGWAYVESLLRLTIYFYEKAFSTDDSPLDSLAEAHKAKSLSQLFDLIRSIEGRFKNSEELREESKRMLKRESPFEGFDIDSYHEKHHTGNGEKVIQKYRNFYAHSTPEQIAARGPEPVKQALATTLRLTDDFLKKEIGPSIVYFTAKGQDEYGRNLLWFVGEKYAHLGPRKRRPENCDFRMYLRDASDIELSKAYVTITPAKPFMVEPPVYRKPE